MSGYTLGCLTAWDPVFKYRWHFPSSESLIINYTDETNRGEMHLLQPLGVLNSEVKDFIIDTMHSAKYQMRIVGVEPAFLEQNPEFAAQFTITTDRNNANYIYKASDLASLSGRRYAKKRNLIAQAVKSYSWTTEPLNMINISECLSLIPESHIGKDAAAIKSAVNNFGEGLLRGILVRIDNRAVAFSMFCQQTSDTVVIHFEHAQYAYKGLHQIVNQEAAKIVAEEGYTYINREEDLGDPGIRQAKESYYPDHLAESLILTIK
ncbi:MAG: DUF2156 domain-containing protein [Fibrobacteres bacterium]|nr:DUF2156 domain-containing protein [Fibrobacterota bacterium]